MSKSFFRIATVLLVCLSWQAQAQLEGEAYYNDLYCQTCHGADGAGNVGVQAPRLAGMEPWYLQLQLEKFRAGIRGTHAMDLQGSEMQPMAALLTDDSITEVVEWVGSWPYVPAEITLAGDAAAGAALYGTCATCHGSSAEGSEALGAPALAGQNDWYLVTQLTNFKAGYRGAHAEDSQGAQMMAFASMLADEKAITDVVSYISTLGR